jgi:hypothetical protein
MFFLRFNIFFFSNWMFTWFNLILMIFFMVNYDLITF